MAKANTKASGTGEFELQFAILELMSDQRIWTNAELKSRLKHSFAWSEEDLKVGKRPYEHKWENRINNALTQSPNRRQSLYAKGHVRNVGHGEHQITEAGLRFIQDDSDVSVEELLAVLERKQSAKS